MHQFNQPVCPFKNIFNCLNFSCPHPDSTRFDMPSADWPERLLYALPPILLLQQVQCQLQAELICMALYWPHWLWFLHIVNMSVRKQWRFSVLDDLQMHGSAQTANGLVAWRLRGSGWSILAIQTRVLGPLLYSIKRYIKRVTMLWHDEDSRRGTKVVGIVLHFLECLQWLKHQYALASSFSPK